MSGHIVNWIVIAAVIWGLICNYKTWRQRSALIDAVYHHGDWLRRQAQFQQVGYFTHLSFMFIFRDPYRLYPDYLVAEAKSAASSPPVSA